MTRYVLLLRAVNVGGTGKLPMAELRKICAASGFRNVQTYIASGNVVCDADGTEAEVKAKFQRQMEASLGASTEVFARSADEIEAIRAANPFREAAPSKVAVIFLNEVVERNVLEDLRGQKNEEIELSGREVYVHYPDGMGQSRLRIPGVEKGTARNINTVTKLSQMANDVPKG